MKYFVRDCSDLILVTTDSYYIYLSPISVFLVDIETMKTSAFRGLDWGSEGFEKTPTPDIENTILDLIEPVTPSEPVHLLSDIDSKRQILACSFLKAL